MQPSACVHSTRRRPALPALRTIYSGNTGLRFVFGISSSRFSVSSLHPEAAMYIRTYTAHLHDRLSHAPASPSACSPIYGLCCRASSWPVGMPVPLQGCAIDMLLQTEQIRVPGAATYKINRGRVPALPQPPPPRLPLRNSDQVEASRIPRRSLTALFLIATSWASSSEMLHATRRP